ncbi:pentapeptide repeat-containing protein [uncultured Croceitalea sp.]|uniref:pentapeptide repeat-containing protein n=1 Tax=uncultured Croceitalea sp. TaxID=1798908 RepID=UPI00374FCD76
MDKPFITEQHFKGEDFTSTPLKRAEYEECTFERCKFQNGFLDNQHFMECEFLACDLSNTNIKHSIFNTITFRECKLLGLRFEDLNDSLLSFQFHNCQMDFASFFQLKIKNTVFKDCTLLETDFTETDLTGAIFSGSNLEKAIFDGTILDKTNFGEAHNFIINPERNSLKKAKFSKHGLLGLLKKYDIVVE